MADSFQKEIPKGRVNLTVEIQTNGAAKTVELPHKTLVIGDYSNGKSTGPVLERKRWQITRFTRDNVMEEINPALTLQVDNKISNPDEEMLVKLNFKRMQDFHPESIVEQVPSLKKLLAMRNLLKELRSNIIDNNALKAKLAEILADERSRLALKQSLDSLLTDASQVKE
jgi:type VI secretion system protein ImpB